MASILPVPSKLSKKAYEAHLPKLREDLVQLQVALKDAPFKVLLIFAGTQGAGRSDMLNTLTSWLDPRGYEVFAFREPTDEERERPLMWRFWRSLPSIGRIGVYPVSWYTETLREEVKGRKAMAQLDNELARIRHFEQLLADNGTLIIKVWLDLTKQQQFDRFTDLKADPATAWRVTAEDWAHHRHYDRLAATAQHIRDSTDQPGAPWAQVNAGNMRARNLAVAKLLQDRFHAHLKMMRARKLTPFGTPPKVVRPLAPEGRAKLQALALDQALTNKEYLEKRDKWIAKLGRSVRTAGKRKRSVIFVFEGWDAAGKGGAIRRLTSAIDARDFRVVPIAKPTDEEISHHYLWRFWRHLPRAGMVTIFDRSWYGRVLVERLEGFCHESDWQRAYREINDFESQLVDHGDIVIKFWLHISKEEQLARFRAREQTAYKHHKINDEDWRNRAKWDAYEIAVGDMLALTDSEHAPWHLIPADNKRFARLEILRLASKLVSAALKEKK